MSQSGLVSLTGSSGSGPIMTINTIPPDAGGNFTINPGTSGAVLTGGTNEITLSFNYLQLAATNNSGNGVIKIGTPVVLHSFDASGTNTNIYVGQAAGNTTSTAAAVQNSGLGAGVLSALTTGRHNTVVGFGSAGAINTGSDNLVIGHGAATALTSGNFNCIVGSGSAGIAITSGSNNTIFGAGAGGALGATDNSNIIIGNQGVNGDVGVIRLGEQGPGLGLQTSCFVAGVAGVTTSNSNFVTIDTTSGQLGAVSGTIPSLPLSLANGGTNANLTASNGGIFYSSSTAGAILSGTATARQMLQSGASTTPAWSTATYPATTTAFQLLASTATSVVGEITAGATGTVLAGATGAVPVFTATPALTSVTLGGGTALANYLQGTYTPTLNFGGASVGITYISQTGEYTRVGNIVFFAINITLSSKGSSTGSAGISLPITPGGSPLQAVTCSVYSAITLSALFTEIGGYVQASQINLVQTGSAQTFAGLANTAFANNTDMYITGFYFTS